ncbi:MAG TPA: DNA starvation/stationary phase protection protein [Terracidiphilus sp.]|jgi:starvation-inducible DNA-binding protein|nr:DNA starvation/stationary phase protection protein [Terracidiphilus sp.]
MNAPLEVAAVSDDVKQMHGISKDGAARIAAELRVLLADVFALYVKTKNFHWHVSGPLFSLYHELLDEQAAQIFAMTDPIAERTRKIGERALLSVGDIARRQRIKDNDAATVSAQDMLAELLADTRELIRNFQFVHELCAAENDFATASVIENWIDESEQRAWVLAETVSA